jgi:four helix bundle suffix protein
MNPIDQDKSRQFPSLINQDNNPSMVANALLLFCVRGNKMLQSQIQSHLQSFRTPGGFTENMTEERLEACRQQAAQAGVPKCPKCGKPMLRRIQKKPEPRPTLLGLQRLSPLHRHPPHRSFLS